MIRIALIAIGTVAAFFAAIETSLYEIRIVLLLATAGSFLLHLRHDHPVYSRFHAAFMALLMCVLIERPEEQEPSEDIGFRHRLNSTEHSLEVDPEYYQRVLQERRELRQKNPKLWKQQILGTSPSPVCDK